MAEEQSTFSAAEETSVVVHSMRQDELRMNKWHVIHIIRKVRDQEDTLPKGDWIVAALALAIALALPLVTADFRDAVGIDRSTWRAADLILTLGFALGTGVLFVWWAFMKLTKRPQSEEEIVQGIIDEIGKTHAVGKP